MLHTIYTTVIFYQGSREKRFIDLFYELLFITSLKDEESAEI